MVYVTYAGQQLPMNNLGTKVLIFRAWITELESDWSKWLFWWHVPLEFLDPVVQSIVSLTILLRHKFVKQISAKVKNKYTDIFC